MGVLDADYAKLKGTRSKASIYTDAAKNSTNPVMNVLGKLNLLPTEEELRPSGLSLADELKRSVAAPLAVIGSVPTYLSGVGSKLASSYAPGLTEEQRQQEIANVPSASAKYDELLAQLSGVPSTTPIFSQNPAVDVLKTAGELATGGVGFAGDVIQGFGTQLNPALFGEKALGKLTPEEEQYLRSIPSNPIAQALAIDYGQADKVGPVRGATHSVFDAIGGVAQKYVADPVAQLSGDKALGDFASNIAMLGAFEAGGKGIGKIKERMTNGKEGVTPTVEEAPKVIEPVGDTPTAEALSPLDSKLELLQMTKAELEAKLGETASAQKQRRVNKQLAEVEGQIQSVFKEKQAETFAPVVEKLGEFGEAAKLEEARVATRKAWADKRAKELATEAGLKLEEMEGARPETLGTPPEKLDVWEALKGEVPKETPPPTESVNVGESPYLSKLREDLKAREVGYPDHSAYLEDLRTQERLSGEGEYGSILRGPTTSRTIELAQVTGKNTDVQAPRKKGVSYEVAISPEGQKTVVKVHFDPKKISPAEVSAFKETFGKESTTLRKGTKEATSQVADGTEVSGREIKEDRFTPAEETLRDRLTDIEEALWDLKDSITERLVEGDPKLGTPEGFAELTRQINEMPEYQRAKTEQQMARQQLDEHLGIKPGSPESEMAAILSTQPKVVGGRLMKDILKDAKEVALAPLKGELGEVGAKEMSPTTKAALSRLEADAKALGRTLEDHLKALEMPATTIYMFTKKYPSGGGTRVTSERDIRRAINPENLNDRVQTHKMKDGSTVLITEHPMNLKGLQELTASNDVGRGALTNPIYFFEKAGPWLKENVYDFARERTHEVTVHERALAKELHEWRKQYSKQEIKDVYTYLVGQRGGGVERLVGSNIKPITELPPKLQPLAQFVEGRFKSYFDRLNEMRTKNGLKPIDRVQNYVTFFGDAAQLSQHLGKDVFVEGDLANKMSEFNDPRNTSFRYGKKTAKHGTIDPNMDALTALHKYGRTAEHHIQIQPVVARVDAILKDWNINTQTGEKTKGSWSFRQSHPKTAEALAKWTDNVSRGYKDKGILSQDAANVIQRLQRNFSSGVIAGNPSSILSQPAAVVLLPAAVGVKGVLRGIGIVNPRNWEIATKSSKHLLGRTFMAELQGFVDVLAEKGPVAAATTTINHVAKVPMASLDKAVAYFSWWAAYKDGLSRGLSKEKASVFADDVTVKVNASGASMDLPDIQNNVLGSAATSLMTYKISFANFLAHEIALNPNIPKVEAAKRAVLTLGAVVGVNMVYNGLGLKSPLTDPIADYNEGIEEGMSEGGALAATAGKTVRNLVGSNYGVSSPLVDVPDTLLKAASGDERAYKQAAITGAALAGVPIPNLMSKVYGALMEDKSMLPLRKE